MDRQPSHWSLLRDHARISAEPLAMSILRVQRGDTGAAARLGEAFGLAWPSTPNTAAGSDPRVIWLAPGTWALLQPADALQPTVDAACADRLHHLSDVSAGHRLWRISGPESRAIVARGCSIDTHPQAFSPGHGARTLFAQVHVLLLAAEPAGSFEMVADASFDGHLQAWFTAALQASA